jgi:hypothetical protein
VDITAKFIVTATRPRGGPNSGSSRSTSQLLYGVNPIRDKCGVVTNWIRRDMKETNVLSSFRIWISPNGLGCPPCYEGWGASAQASISASSSASSAALSPDCAPIHRVLDLVEQLYRLLPGVLLCITITRRATLLQAVEVHVVGQAYLEALVLAILLGVVVRATWTPQPRFLPGVAFSAKFCSNARS